jgi:hypothetical protein
VFSLVLAMLQATAGHNCCMYWHLCHSACPSPDLAYSLLVIHWLQSPAVKTLEHQLLSSEAENTQLRARLLKQQALMEKHGLLHLA